MQIRARNDLIARQRGSAIDAQWVVKDPISFTHFLFSPEELFLLNLFDGDRTLEQIRRRWQEEFQTRSLTEQQLQEITGRFIRDKLVQVDKFGIGVELHQDERNAQKSQLYMKLASPLVIKLGGVDPREILNLLWLPGRILFNRVVVCCSLAFSFVVFLYFIGHFETIIQRASTMADFFSPKNIVVMMLIIVVVKIIHELGHAVACRNYGGECFEIGVLLLAFFPTLYCDVTDSWMFRERWKRIMVSFAGIYIEILLATACVVLWLMTGPGLANSIFFNVAVMCSINTIFINGNPLLKYDGYYIVSDWFEQPNLTQNAQLNFQRFKQSFFYKLDEKTPVNGWLALFGGLSTAYRLFVIFSIITGVYLLLKAFSFGGVAEAVAIFLFAITGVRMLKQRTSESRAVNRRLNVPRTLATTLMLGLIGAAICYMPLPSNVYCNVAVESEDSSMVYASSKGRLQLQVAPYSKVVAGQVLGVISNVELDEKRSQTAKRLRHLDERSNRLRRQTGQGVDVASEIQLIEYEIKNVASQLKLLDEEQAALSISSEIDGIVRPLEVVSDRQLEIPAEATFFDSEFQGCFVSRGQPVFIVEGNSKRLVSYLGEKDVEYLGVGQHAIVRFNNYDDEKISATIEDIIPIDVDLNAAETANSGLETYVDQTGARKTLQTPYRAIIVPRAFPPSTRVGATGRARISVASTTLAQKAWSVLERWWKSRNY